MIKTNYQNHFVGLLFMGCAIILLAAGCEQTADPFESAMNVAGTWLLTEEDEKTTHVLELEQKDTLLTGTMAAFFGTKAPVVGFVSEDSITMIVALDPITNSTTSSDSSSGTVDFYGTIAPNTNSMSGNWWNSQQAQGTWVATRAVE